MISKQLDALGHRLRSARAKVGMTAYLLAEKLGTSRQNYERIETGKHRPAPKMLAAIGKELNIPYSELVSLALQRSVYRMIRHYKEEETNKEKEEAVIEIKIDTGDP